MDPVPDALHLRIYKSARIEPGTSGPTASNSDHYTTEDTVVVHSPYTVKPVTTFPPALTERNTTRSHPTAGSFETDPSTASLPLVFCRKAAGTIIVTRLLWRQWVGSRFITSLNRCQRQKPQTTPPHEDGFSLVWTERRGSYVIYCHRLGRWRTNLKGICLKVSRDGPNGIRLRPEPQPVLCEV
jgi:hypothetical protein